jgi:hypothetical protein
MALIKNEGRSVKDRIITMDDLAPTDLFLVPKLKKDLVGITMTPMESRKGSGPTP